MSDIVVIQQTTQGNGQMIQGLGIDRKGELETGWTPRVTVGIGWIPEVAGGRKPMETGTPSGEIQQ